MNIAMISILNIITLSSRKNNRTVCLIALSGLQPNKEKISSIIFIFTFSWVDLEEEHAAAIMDAFHTTTKTLHLLYTLLNHLKNDLYTIFMENILAWGYIVTLFLSILVISVAMGQSLYVSRKLSIKMRKAQYFSISKFDIDNFKNFQTNIGAIISLVAIDTHKVSEVYTYIHNLFITVPLNFMFAYILIYNIIGWNAIIGFCGILLSILLNSYLSSSYHKIQKKLISITDNRINSINEIFQNIQQFSELLSSLLDSKISIDKINTFLKEEEIQKYSKLFNYLPLPDNPIIGFRDATFTWASEKDVINNAESYLNSFCIYDLNINFPLGKLIVIGPIGSGKTSLLMALLDEMTYLIPDLQTSHTESVAYCAQQLWLLTGTM
ncbi:hypothetical protein PCK1_000167 [Pneumocystis canis]|nr:hypothetical protein PCK1_000167 [Pneumocystis canis]